MASRTRYVMCETLISAAINTALSIAFVFIAFHGASQIQAKSISVDMAPQTFMVTLMSCLIPALLTRRRIRGNALAWHQSEFQAVLGHLWLRAVIVAILVTCGVVALSWLVLPRWIPAGVSFRSLLLGKALFGALLAGCTTPWAIGKVLR